ncbi:hypothetical protein V9T40_006940 [Parthenolecanium corni]|uniref:Uncharacterized protein n=1 Tax=Parthenolecanium corni TaxID=536013 RepID=A0AAN9TWJ6_9HEMI
MSLDVNVTPGSCLVERERQSIGVAVQPKFVSGGLCNRTTSSTVGIWVQMKRIISCIPWGSCDETKHLAMETLIYTPERFAGAAPDRNSMRPNWSMETWIEKSSIGQAQCKSQ